MKTLFLDLLPAYIPFIIQCTKGDGDKVDPTVDNLIIYEEGGANGTFDSTTITGSPFDPDQVNSKTGLWGKLIDKSVFTAGKIYIALWEMTVDGKTTAMKEVYFVCNASDFKSDISDLALEASVQDAITAIGTPMQAGSEVVLTEAYDAAKTAAQESSLESIEDALYEIKGEGWSTETLKAIYDLGTGGASIGEIEEVLEDKFKLFGDLRTVLVGGAHTTTTFKIDLGEIGQGLDLTGYSVMFNGGGSNPYAVRKIQSWEDLAEGITAITVEELESVPEDEDAVILGVLPNMADISDLALETSVQDVITELESQRFSDGVVHVDTVLGSSGTDYPLGEATAPVDSLAGGVSIATANKIKRIHITGTPVASTDLSSFTLEGDNSVSSNLTLSGDAWVNVKNVTLSGASSSGIQSAYNCLIYLCSCLAGDIYDTSFGLDNAVLSGNSAKLVRCRSIYWGQDPTISVATAELIVNGWQGNMTIKNGNADTVVQMILEGAIITLDSSCTGGIYTFSGIGTIIDNSTGTTVTDNTITPTDISDLALEASVQDVISDLAELKATLIIKEGTVVDVSPTVQSFNTSLTEINDYWNSGAILWKTGSANAGVIRAIKDFSHTDGEMVMNTNLPVVPVNGDEFVIIMSRAFKLAGLEASEIEDACDASFASYAPALETSAQDILTAVGNIEGGGASVEEIVSGVEASTVIAKEASVQDIKTKTDNLPSDPADASDVAGLISAIAGTLTTINNNVLSRLASSGYTAPDNATIAAISAAIGGTSGLDALKTLLEGIDTSSELESRFTEIKGAGFTTETLKAIKDSLSEYSGEITLAAIEEYLAGIHGAGSWQTGSPYIINIDANITDFDEFTEEIKIYTGTAPELVFTVTKDGVAVDLSGKSVYLVVKKNAKTLIANAILNKLGVVSGDNNNIVTFTLSKAETDAFTGKEGDYAGQLDIGPDQSVTPKFNVRIERKLRQ